MSNEVHLFQEAVRKDDINEVKSLLLKYPKLWDDIRIRSSASSENPPLTACEHGSHQVAKHIGNLWPKVAKIQNQHGYTPMHIASERGDLEMVKFWGELNPRSCLIEDNSSIIPLHRAVINGHSDVIRILISICPGSLRKLTSNKDTVLHLAVKNSQFEVFKVLVNQIKIHNEENLFNRKNEDGNTVLYLATSKKFIDIVKLLLVESSNSRKRILVNSTNKDGQTALDLCKANSDDEVFNEIDLILRGAATRQQSHQQQLPTSTTNARSNLKRWTVETRNLLLAVVGILAAVFLTITCNLPDSFLKEVRLEGNPFSAKDILSGGLPRVFYLMIFNSAGFLTTLTAMVILVWGLRLRTILLFLISCACIVHIILANGIIPKFTVRVGKFRIPSVGLMWLLVFAIIGSGITILSLGKYISPLSKKKMNCCSNSTVDDLDP